MSAALRWSLAALTIALFVVLGMLGEQMQSLARLPMSKCAAGLALPAPTEIAFAIFGLNAGDFFLSLTPFMIVATAIAACARPSAPAAEVLARYALTWLAAFAYVGLYAWAMLLPYKSGCAELEDRPTGWIMLAIDAALVVAAIVLWRAARRGAR